MGEGAWIYVLEEYERRAARGAKIYAEITGYGATCDAYHRVRLEDTGEEPARAMRSRLKMRDAFARCRLRQPSRHSQRNLTTASKHRRSNSRSVQTRHAIPMSATKSQIGHPQGASGAAGIAAALCAMHTNIIPPTINLDEPDPECDLDYVPNRRA